MIRSVATGKMLSNRPPVLPIESPRFAVETVSLMLKRKHQKMWSQTPRTVDIDQDCRGSECDSHCVSFTRKIGNWWNWFVKFDKKWHDNNSLKSNFKKWKLILICLCLVKIGWRPIIAFALMLASQSAFQWSDFGEIAQRKSPARLVLRRRASAVSSAVVIRRRT